jgi:hypothetical protein
MDSFPPDTEFELAMHDMALDGGMTDAMRALFARRDSARVHLVVDRLARAVNMLPEAQAGRGVSVDKSA